MKNYSQLPSDSRISVSDSQNSHNYISNGDTDKFVSPQAVKEKKVLINQKDMELKLTKKKEVAVMQATTKKELKIPAFIE